MQSRIQHRVVLAQTGIVALGLLIMAVFLPQLRVEQPVALALFATAVAVSRLFDIQLPQGGKLHIDTSVIIASILLFPLPATMLIVTVGLVASMLIRHVKLEFVATMYPLSLKLIAMLLSSHVFYFVGGRAGSVEPLYGLVALSMLCGAYTVLALGLDQLTLSINRGTPYIRAFHSSFKFLAPIYLALGSLGVLLAIMYEGMGPWGIALFFVPLLVTRLSFKSFLDIRKAYRKTIEALANAIEAQNPRRRGHGQRVANYAVDMAKEMGMQGRDLELIGYAALLHDIGMLGVDEDSLDHLLEQASTRGGEAPHALIGAEIIERVDFLKDAATMVRKHHIPIDKVASPDELPVGARIINVASYFDKLTQADSFEQRLTAYQAISKIKKEQAIRFDPKAVRALISVLRKQGKLMEFVG